ncbi:unannotated protein [freshwater metagenome]|uniref:Unannotated protein n=1 Tax=freshwater metagenome TaxID=449393 RepID=A0A6J6LIJ3_9ZZZZ
MSDDLGVARIGGLISKYGRAELRTPKNLVHIRQLHLPVSLSSELRSEVTGPQSAIFHNLLQRTNGFFIERAGLVVDHVLTGKSQIKRLDLGLYELANPVELLLECWIDTEIGHDVFPLSEICSHGRPDSQNQRNAP